MRQLLTDLRADAEYWLRNMPDGVLANGEAIRIDRRELWEMLDQVPVAIMISNDRMCRTIVGNLAANALLKIPHGGNLSQSAPADEAPPFKVYQGDRLVPPEELPMQVSAATGRSIARSECNIRFNDGRAIYLSGHTIPLRDEAGELCGSIGAFIDITSRVTESDTADIISREMSHRLKNSTALVTAISRMTIKSHVPAAVYAAYEDRLLSLSRLKELGYLGDWKRISWRELVEDSIFSVVGLSNDRVTLAGPEFDIEPAIGQNIGMILHELITNACKYGSMSQSGGTLDISWALERDEQNQRVTCIWKEARGPEVTEPTNEGFGTRLVGVLAKALPDGRVERLYRPEGFQAVISLKLR